MTRFARAKGSKASNERVPEDATSWRDMKKQLEERNKQVEEAKKKQEADKQREKNYKIFLQDVEEEQVKNNKWAEFSTEKPAKKKKNEIGNNSINTVIKKKSRKEPANNESNQSTVKNKNRKLVVAESVTDKESEKSASSKSKSKTTKKKSKNQNIDQKEKKKQGLKRKSSAPENEVSPNKKAKKEELSEEELKKIEKKKQKKLRQLEKRKFKEPQKKRDNKIHERRKKPIDKMFINGKEVEIAYVDGFPIKKEDAERIHELRKQMISKGLPRSEIKIALKLERRKAEKAFAREKKKVCFNCRKSGHNLSECPELGQQQLTESAGTGICFKCGSTEHTHFECKVVRGQEFKFAQCFICREQGHIARQCPDNARGLYPKGGACKVCGDVTHLKKDCPKYQTQQKQLEESVHLETMAEDDNPDSLGKSEEPGRLQERKRPNKIIKF